MKSFGVLGLAAVVAACATSPEKIQTQYVSPIQYQSYDCEQLGAELSRVSRRQGELYRDLKGEADADQAQMAVGIILFFPALFWLEGGDDARAGEYARLKGEFEAMQTVSVQKKCGLVIRDSTLLK